MLKAILFDLDDTLIDWRNPATNWQEGSRAHMRKVFHYLNNHIHTLEDEEGFHDLAWELTLQEWDSARRTLQAPHMGNILVKTCLTLGIPAERINSEILLDVYDWQPVPGVVPFADVHEVLPILQQRGLKLGLITNAFQPMRMRIRELDAFGLTGYLHPNCRLSAADVGFLKPHPRIFQAALEALEVEASETVFVGDSLEADIIGAQAVGIRGVLRVNNGFARPTSIIPDAEIQSLHELLPYLEEWFA